MKSKLRKMIEFWQSKGVLEPIELSAELGVSTSVIREELRRMELERAEKGKTLMQLAKEGKL